MVEFRKVAGAVGAEVSGVDLSKPLSAAQVSTLRQGWLEHLVLFFRDQPLTPEQYMDFAGRWGTPVEYPFVRGLAGFPKIIEVKKLEDERVNFGGIWHSDTAYLDQPPMASMLLAREIPPWGGDTLFASMYAAWDALSEGMRGMLRNLKAVNASAKADVSKTREDRIRTDGNAQAPAEFVAEHPVARTHPETGRVALYVNPGHTVRFSGCTEEESRPLLEYLFQHQVRPEFTCRLVWRPATLALWDNRCTQHNPVNDYHGFRRVMHRITLAGDRPR
ncbi:MAG: TauD/TfdA dioxygenase family protein [Burkholderiales bacterium]